MTLEKVQKESIYRINTSDCLIYLTESKVYIYPIYKADNFRDYLVESPIRHDISSDLLNCVKNNTGLGRYIKYYDSIGHLKVESHDIRFRYDLFNNLDIMNDYGKITHIIPNNFDTDCIEVMNGGVSTAVACYDITDRRYINLIA